MDVSDFLPGGFNLRKGAGGGDPRNGLCFMETVALIAGERVDDHPTCACRVLTIFGISLNDSFTDEDRRLLLPLAWATAGTVSEDHVVSRQKIIAVALIDAARLVLPFFQAKYPNDNRPFAALDAAEKCLIDPTVENRKALVAAAYAASAVSAAYAAAYAAYAAAYAAYAAAYAYAGSSIHLRVKVRDRLIKGLRDAIKAGPNGGLPDEIVIDRLNRVRDLLPVSAV